MYLWLFLFYGVLIIPFSQQTMKGAVTATPMPITTITSTMRTEHSAPTAITSSRVIPTSTITTSTPVLINTNTTTKMNETHTKPHTPVTTNYIVSSRGSATNYTSTTTTLKSVVNTNTNITKNMTKEHAETGPITLTITPNVSKSYVYEGNTNLTCIASGANLPKILPYELVWFEQGNGGKDNEILKTCNSTRAVLHHSTLEKHGGQTIYCALIGHFTPKHHWKIFTQYITIYKGDPSATASVQTTATIGSTSSKAIIASITGVTCLLALIATAVFLYRRFQKKSRTPPVSETDEPSAGSQENVYTYVPLQPVSFYEARNMVAANLKVGPAAVKPPPLPARPQHHRYISEEEEYIYSYAYGIKK